MMNTTALLESGCAEAHALSREVASLRGDRDGLRRLLADGAILVDHCQEYPSRLRRHWKSFQNAAANAVLPVEQLGPFFTSFLALAGACLKTVEVVRQGLGEAEQLLEARNEAETEQGLEERGAAGEALTAPDLASLDAAMNALLALQSEVATLWLWLKTPMAPGRPLRTTAEIREARNRGEYVGVEDAIAELGGPPSEAS